MGKKCDEQYGKNNESGAVSFSETGRQHRLGLAWRMNYIDSALLCLQDEKKQKNKKKKKKKKKDGKRKEYVWNRVIICEPCEC